MGREECGWPERCRPGLGPGCRLAETAYKARSASKARSSRCGAGREVGCDGAWHSRGTPLPLGAGAHRLLVRASTRAAGATPRSAWRPPDGARASLLRAGSAPARSGGGPMRGSVALRRWRSCPHSLRDGPRRARGRHRAARGRHQKPGGHPRSAISARFRLIGRCQCSAAPPLRRSARCGVSLHKIVASAVMISGWERTQAGPGTVRLSTGNR